MRDRHHRYLRVSVGLPQILVRVDTLLTVPTKSVGRLKGAPAAYQQR